MTVLKDDKFKQIKAAIEERDAFLAEHPELRYLQDEITKRMKSAGGEHNRLVVISQMMTERLHMLKEAMLELQTATQCRKNEKLQ